MKNNTLVKIATVCLLVTTFLGCESKEHVQSDIERLKNERITLQADVKKLLHYKNSKQNEIVSLDEKIKELNIYKSGRIPKYILKIHLSQTHISLDLDTHVKDMMNAINFELPVDSDFYNSVSVGTRIVDGFRVGSFILNGSMGNWNMSIQGKELR